MVGVFSRLSEGLDHFVDYRAYLVYLALHHISFLKEKTVKH